jgi:hypothetical protein
MYIVVPHRNRFENLGRLLSSLNNATAASPNMRACLCVVIADFASTPAALPPWRNPSCVASLNPDFNVLLDNDALVRTPERRIDALAALHSSGVQEPCPEAGTSGSGAGAAAAAPAGGATPAGPPVLDISGLGGEAAMRHTMAVYRGDSLLVDGKAFVGRADVSFSRAGGIMAGVRAIRTPPERSLIFICDADMMLRPGFLEMQLNYTVSLSERAHSPRGQLGWGKP